MPDPEKEEADELESDFDFEEYEDDGRFRIRYDRFIEKIVDSQPFDIVLSTATPFPYPPQQFIQHMSCTQ